MEERTVCMLAWRNSKKMEMDSGLCYETNYLGTMER